MSLLNFGLGLGVRFGGVYLYHTWPCMSYPYLIFHFNTRLCARRMFRKHYSQFK
ncbi:hypothetical protein L227DRAFT_316721 [Lentinus tigrinus ALCF2SS1-6]|uniref:Uncharacterized protein n=1 Tax=Lentinus tigrinus ALCF2SS1-6 TaxID=1328759 RepID=A0A5C2SLM6_9APHY|nr:hypothetical protein L227DRAFT_316721 [Lentinus tigrinus ALCF2SS1-6]